MLPSKPDLIVLPFKAVLAGTSIPLTLGQTLFLWKGSGRGSVHIERTYPGAPGTIGWTIFRLTRQKYLYENEPLFRFERGARRSRSVRKAYAIHYSRLSSEDGMTYSHLNL
jgi:hypothetical protein